MEGEAGAADQYDWRRSRERFGIKDVDDGIWRVSVMTYDLGSIDLEQRSLQTIDNPFDPMLSPMSQVQTVTYVSGMDTGRTMMKMVPQEGLEPPTHALRMRCSTI